MRFYVKRSLYAVLIPCALMTSCTREVVTPVAGRSGEAGPTPIAYVRLPEVDRNRYQAEGSEFAIATQGDATTRAARQMFELGGNVFDAAAAASFAISVERPQSTGIGGGGFMVIYHADTHKAEAVDFREKAPQKAYEKMYLDAKGEVVPGASRQGARAVAVPGMVAGVLEIQQKYGKLKRSQVLQPAIELAEKGYVVYPHLAEAIKEHAPTLWKSVEAQKVFFKGDKHLVLGDVVRQPELAKTLKEISKKGRAGFYKGWVASAFLGEQKRLGGVITQKDLDRYDVKYRTPVRGQFKGYEVVSMPPPSSGGVHVIEILNILEGFPLDPAGPYSVSTVHRTAAAMQLAFRDRSKYLGDSDFVTVPTVGLTSETYAEKLRATIGERAKHQEEVVAPHPKAYESTQTAHFTIADRHGNVVSSTQTINGWFGSGVVVPKAGFVMNNEMDDFSAKPGAPNAFGVVGGKENAIAPGKRPLSSMSPTVVLRGGKPVVALGSPAGSHIITCVTLTLLNYLSYDLPLYDSVAALRYHHQWTPDKISVEAPGFPGAVPSGLESLGYSVAPVDSQCRVQAVALEKDKLISVSDPRGEGLAATEKPIRVATEPVPTRKE